MPDLTLLVVELLFGLLFGWAVWTAIRRRSVLARDVALVFAPLAALLGSSGLTALLRALEGPAARLPGWITIPVLVLLLLQPVFSLKLVSDLRSLPSWLLPAVLAAVTITGGLTLATLPEPEPLAVLAAVGVFFGGQAIAAAYLFDAARARSGGARVRLGLAAGATAGVGLALFVLGLGTAGVAEETLVDNGARLLALLAAVGYLIAFLPPAWLRRQWVALSTFQHSERLLAISPSAGSEELWSDLARTASALTGAGVAILVPSAAGVTVVGAKGVPLEEAGPYPAGALDELVAGDPAAPTISDLRARSACDYITTVPIRRDEAIVGAVLLCRPHASLFDSDDRDVVSRLAVRSAYLVQRREILAQEQRLTEQLRLTVDALEAASAAKSDFLASMSHELRTPLNAIIGFSELMVTDNPDAEMLTVPREWVDHIRTGGAHLVGLINDVLDLAKIEAGRLELVKVPVDVGHAVGESVAGLRPLADRKRQTIVVEAAPMLIEADAGRLRQILYNLLSNAIKYTGEGGLITVRCRRAGHEVAIEVEDTGVGISADDQHHVFEEFRQVGDPRTRLAGTGLGLALTKRLLEAHGGRIDLRSVPGEGSTFTATLPAGAPAEESPAAGPVEPSGADRTGAARILIIEDDPSSVRLLQAYLEESGYGVSVASDGERGLAMALADPPAAILLDVLLPKIDGWEVLRRLKSDPRVRDVPVVIVTVVDERNVGLALGAVDYFVKPIERDALLARLERHTFLAKVRYQPVDVLAIDDDPVALDMIDATLAPFGFAVHRARSGQEGLHLVD
ncbi:MAG TPA: ATP-binding protein, partial [Clostridia bacterium]|nr:ATP-binding protein [Clostridia bacterium]